VTPLQPFLFLPPHTVASKQKRTGGGSRISTPTAAQQKARLDAKLQSIASGLSSIQTTTEGIEPEQVIVFETLGDSIENFAKAASKIAGLEWVGELELEDVVPVHGFSASSSPSSSLGCRLYAVFSNQQAIQQLLGLWNAWTAHPQKRAKQGFGPYKNMFEHLLDVRRWGVEDRLRETFAMENWQVFLESSEETHRFEIELWCRNDERARSRAYQSVNAIIAGASGRVITQCVRPEILYHGLLVELPKPALQQVVQEVTSKSYTRLLLSEDVMFFRPHVQAATKLGKIDGDSQELPALPAATARDSEPVVALLDGLSLENHEAYRRLIVVDDPDDLQSRYSSPGAQLHGTAMASLIVRGDLERDDAPLERRIYHRPIMTPKINPSGESFEEIPSDQLIVDIIHRAVHRLFEDENSPAKKIKVINLSIGDRRYIYLRQLSPLARLLDWLAWKYQVLFIVSAGNQTQEIALPVESLDGLDDQAIQKLTLKAIFDDRRNRRLFSPAEAMNVLTVGALHQDQVQSAWQDQRSDLLPQFKGISPVSTICPGFLRSIKPDLLASGGRQLYRANPLPSNPRTFKLADSNKSPGLKVAAPGTSPMSLNNTIYSRGSSNATALTTRAAAQAFESISALRNTDGIGIPDAFVSAMLRTLLVHSASWPDDLSSLLQEQFCSNTMHWSKKKSILSTFLGFGHFDASRVTACSDQRATALGWGTIAAGEGHIFEFPLPPCLASTRTKRKLSVTLSWFSPINPRHRKYRKALLWFTLADNLLGVSFSDADEKTTQRGTLKHQVYESEQAKVFTDGDTLKVQVNCDSDAGELECNVQYALAVTLEVTEGITLPLYQQVKERIKVPVSPRVATST
jgi:hypothetical protein